MMAYLGRGKLAVLYCLAEVALHFAGAWAIAAAGGSRGAEWLASLALIGFRLFGAMHGYRLATRLPPSQVFPRYTRWFFPWHAPWYSLIVVIAVFAVTYIAFQSLLFQSFSTAASSMYPTIRTGDYVVANKSAYGFGKFSFPFNIGPASKIFASKPERGDVVVFTFPPQPEIDYVKRVVGLPGDKVQFMRGILYINGEPAPKEQIEIQHNPDGQGANFTIYSEKLPNDRTYRIAEDKLVPDTSEFVVPDGHYFVLGDNRNRSIDSRHDAGSVPADHIFGKVVLVLFSDRDRVSFRWVD